MFLAIMILRNYFLEITILRNCFWSYNFMKLFLEITIYEIVFANNNLTKLFSKITKFFLEDMILQYFLNEIGFYLFAYFHSVFLQQNNVLP